MSMLYLSGSFWVQKAAFSREAAGLRGCKCQPGREFEGIFKGKAPEMTDLLAQKPPTHQDSSYRDTRRPRRAFRLEENCMKTA